MTRRIWLGRFSCHLVTRSEWPQWSAGYKRDRDARYVWLDLYLMRLCAIWHRAALA